MRTYGKDKTIHITDIVNINVMAQLVLCNLRKGDVITMLHGKTFTVEVATKKTLKITSSAGEKYILKPVFFEKYSVWATNIKSKKRGANKAHQLLRDIEAELTVDLINRNNPLHKFSDFMKILIERDPIYMQKGWLNY